MKQTNHSQSVPSNGASSTCRLAGSPRRGWLSSFFIPMDGWIKLHRKIHEWEWWTEPYTAHLFIHMLLKANHKPNNWRGQMVETGQFISSRMKLSVETGIPEQSVRTIIKRLEKTKELTSKSTSKYTLYTIKNWEKYQVEEKANQQNNQQLTSNQPATNQQLTTNKNEKNEENDKNKKNTHSLGEILNAGPSYWLNFELPALNAWQSVLACDPTVVVADVVLGAERYKSHCEKCDIKGRFIGQPDTWLRSGKWKMDWDRITKEKMEGDNGKRDHRAEKRAREFDEDIPF